MVVPRSVFQYTAEYITLHEPPAPRDCFCFSCKQQFWQGVWLYSNYNGLRLVRRHLLCAYKKNLLTHAQARKFNHVAPSAARLEAMIIEGPVLVAQPQLIKATTV